MVAFKSSYTYLGNKSFKGGGSFSYNLFDYVSVVAPSYSFSLTDYNGSLVASTNNQQWFSFNSITGVFSGTAPSSQNKGLLLSVKIIDNNNTSLTAAADIGFTPNSNLNIIGTRQIDNIVLGANYPYVINDNGGLDNYYISKYQQNTASITDSDSNRDNIFFNYGVGLVNFSYSGNNLNLGLKSGGSLFIKGAQNFNYVFNGANYSGFDQFSGTLSQIISNSTIANQDGIDPLAIGVSYTSQFSIIGSRNSDFITLGSTQRTVVNDNGGLDQYYISRYADNNISLTDSDSMMDKVIFGRGNAISTISTSANNNYTFTFANGKSLFIKGGANFAYYLNEDDLSQNSYAGAQILSFSGAGIYTSRGVNIGSSTYGVYFTDGSLDDVFSATSQRAEIFNYYLDSRLVISGANPAFEYSFSGIVGVGGADTVLGFDIGDNGGDRIRFIDTNNVNHHSITGIQQFYDDYQANSFTFAYNHINFIDDTRRFCILNLTRALIIMIIILIRVSAV